MRACSLRCRVVAAALLLPLGSQGAETLALGGTEPARYLTLDADTAKLYIATGAEVVVVDPASLTVTGRLAGLNGAKSVVIVPGGHGYATDSRSATVTVFDPRTNTAIGSIPAGSDTDFITYDKASGRVFALNDDDGSITAIDPATDATVRTIFLPGGEGLGSAEPDGAGHLLLAHPARNELVRIDTKRLEVDAHIKLPGCLHPDGLALGAEGRAYVSCANSTLLAVDSGTGATVASAPIGPRSRTVLYDAQRHRVYAAGDDGTLAVLDASAPSGLQPLPSVPTGEGARTAAEDQATGAVYLVSQGTLMVVNPGSP